MNPYLLSIAGVCKIITANTYKKQKKLTEAKFSLRNSHRSKRVIIKLMNNALVFPKSIDIGVVDFSEAYAEIEKNAANKQASVKYVETIEEMADKIAIKYSEDVAKHKIIFSLKAQQIPNTGMIIQPSSLEIVDNGMRLKITNRTNSNKHPANPRENNKQNSRLEKISNQSFFLVKQETFNSSKGVCKSGQGRITLYRVNLIQTLVKVKGRCSTIFISV
jgi:hypothetical protein